MLDNASFMQWRIGSQKSPNVVSEYLNFQPDFQDILPNCWQLHSQPSALPNFASDFPSLTKKPWLWIPGNKQLSLWGPLVALYSQHQQSEPGALNLILSYSRLLLFCLTSSNMSLLTETMVCWLLAKPFKSVGESISQYADDVTYSLWILNHDPLYDCLF